MRITKNRLIGLIENLANIKSLYVLCVKWCLSSGQTVHFFNTKYSKLFCDAYFCYCKEYLKLSARLSI